MNMSLLTCSSCGAETTATGKLCLPCECGLWTIPDEPKTTGKWKVIQMDNENGKLPATEKQKQYIIDLTERITREQASRVIDILKSGATNSYAPAKTNGELPITEKQKACIKEIYSENDWNWDEEEISSMTREEASELISGCIGGGVE